MDTDDISLAKTHYRELVEIEGFILRKPLEYVIFEDVDSLEEKYTAMHTLPSKNEDQMGVELEGIGETIGDAADSLTKKITDLYEKLCCNDPTSPDQFIQRAYLRSIMVKK